MRRYWSLPAVIMLIMIVVVTGCMGDVESVNLNTAEMIEADDSMIDPHGMGPGVIAAYLYDTTKSSSGDTIPAVDVFVCKSFKRDSVLGDTILILDTHLRKKISGDPDIYWVGIQIAKRWKTCKVAVPPDQLNKIRKYPYRYAQVTLVTDD
jgi:hypothetical protein